VAQIHPGNHSPRVQPVADPHEARKFNGVYFSAGHQLRHKSWIPQGGNLSPQFQSNLANLHAIREAGFLEVEVGFFPPGEQRSDPDGRRFSDDYFQENGSVIQSLCPIIVA